MSVKLNLDIDARTRGAEAGLARMTAAMAVFERNVKSNNRILSDLSTNLKQAQTNFRKLDSDISRTGHTARALSLNFYELRSAIRNLVTRSAITGFAVVASAITSLASAATLAASSIGNLGSALAVAGGAGLAAAFQGIGVAALGLNGVIKALTTTGTLHEKAMAKLTVTAQQFVKQFHPILIEFREIKLLTQEGIFPGLLRGMKDLIPLFGQLKQVAYDTAVSMGYLAERGAAMLAKRAGLVVKILQDNIKLIQRYGRAFENFGAGMLEAWVAAIPLIDHVAKKVEGFSIKFKDSMREWRKDGSLGQFFGNLRESFDNWTKIAKGFGETFFNIWKSSQPAVHQMERDLASLFGKWAKWTHDNGALITVWFQRMQKPFYAFGKLLGDTIKLVFQLGNRASDSLAALFTGLDQKFLPLIGQLAIALQDDFVGKLGSLFGAMLDFVSAAMPGLKLVLKHLGYIAQGFTTIFTIAKQFVDWAQNNFGSLGGAIATALSVGGIAATWIALRTQIALTLGLFGRGGAFIKKQAAKPLTALGSEVTTQGRMAVSGPLAYLGTRSRVVPTPTPVPTTAIARRVAIANYPRVPSANQTVPITNIPRGMPGGMPVLTARPRERIISSGVPMSVRGLPTSRIPEPVVRGVNRQNQPIFVTPRMRSTTPEPRLRGTSVNEALRPYRQSMVQETQKGFLGGLKGIKGMAAFGAIAGSLGLSLGLAVAIPVGIAVIGALGQALKDKRPEIVKQVSTLTRDIVKVNLNPKGGLPERPQQNPIFQKLSSQLDFSIKNEDAQGIRNVASALDKVGASLKDVEDKNKIKELVSDLGALAAQTSAGIIDRAADDFTHFGTAAHDSIGHILDALNVLKTQITVKMPVAGEEYNLAMGKAFGRAADAIQAGIDQGFINEKKGLKKIHELLIKEFKAYGFTAQEARHLADPSNKNKSLSGAGGGNESGATSHAGTASTSDRTPGGHFERGGYVAGKGRVGHDSVPYDVDGRKIVTAPGEYVGVFTRQQQGFIESNTGMSMPQIFQSHKTPHYASKGGIWKLGERIQSMTYDGTPYNVSENSHFGGVHPVHVKGSYHYKDEALDINHDLPAGSEKGALDKLAGMLKGEGWHVIWQAPGHYDHLHVDDATSGSLPPGGKSAALKHLVPPKANMSGLIGGLIQGTLNRATTAANKRLDGVAGQGMGDVATEGSVKYKPSAALSSLNHVFPKHFIEQAGYAQFAPGLVKKIAQWAGLPGDIFERIAHGESNYEPGVIQHDPGDGNVGYGLWQATPHAWGAHSKALSYMQALGGVGQMLNPLKNAKMSKYLYEHAASKKPNTPGFPWFGTQYLDLGGMVEAFTTGGTPKPPPTSGNRLPKVDPNDAITPGSDKKKKKAKDKKKAKPKAKDKKKKVVRIAGNRPTVGMGVGVGSFRPKSKKPKPSARKRVSKLINKAFSIHDTEFIDPLTGEQMDIGTYLPLASITGIEGSIDNLSGELDSLIEGQGLTEEQAIVTLQDTQAFPDLSNYLRSIGQDPSAWMEKNGDALDIVNANGMTIQGQYIPGVTQAVAELNAQLAFHQGGKYPVMGILQRMLKGQGIAENIPSRQAIMERLARLEQVRRVFKANVALRKSYKKKLNHMTKKNYTWQDAVAHNQDIITKWQRWKRDSINEPQADTDRANHEMDRLRDLNTQLRKKKPKGKVYGSEEYQRTMSIYQGRGIENRMLVGDKDLLSWDPGQMGGFAGKLISSVSNWRGIDSERERILGDYPGRIRSENDNIASIKANIAEWTGTTAPSLPVPKDDATAAPEDDGLAAQLAMEKVRSALLGSTQFDVLKDFTSILGMRMLGGFAHGGIIGETGMALVHKGEYITPSPDGPFRNGMNAPNYNSNHNFAVHVHMGDRTSALTELVDARVERVAPAAVSRATGRNTRRLSAAPGPRHR